MASWLWLLIGLWAGMGLGMAVTAFIFLPANHQVKLERQVKSPQTLLAEWAIKQ